MAAQDRRVPSPLRILTAGSTGDGQGSDTASINAKLARHGLEVICLDHDQSAADIARAALLEDVHAIGLAARSRGHAAFSREIKRHLKSLGRNDLPIFSIRGDAVAKGSDSIFSAATSLAEIIAVIQKKSARSAKPQRSGQDDRALARAISRAEAGTDRATVRPTRRHKSTCETPAFVLGIAGPGGAGKSTLIAELTSRFLQRVSHRRIAILANDPTHPPSHGAILGDRVSPVFAHDGRVFFRSFATRGSFSGLSSAVPAAIDILHRNGEFDLILVESVGGNPPSDPFRIYDQKFALTDAVLFVLDPYYGGRLQLQKIAAFNTVDLIALNKCDHPAAATTREEVQAFLSLNGQAPRLHCTTATSHFDPGTDGLFDVLAELADLVTHTGGEKPCMMRVMG